MGAITRWAAALTVAATLSITAGSATAAASWGPTLTISPTGVAPTVALDGHDVLHVLWQQANRDNVTVPSAQLTAQGRLTASASPFDRSLANVQLYASTAVAFIPGGGSVVCSTNRGGTKLYASFYSPSGRLLRSALLAGSDIFTGNFNDGCEVASSAGHSVITWAVRGTVSTRYQAGRQLMLAHVLPGARLSTPVPMLSDAQDELLVNGGDVRESVAVTSSGWVALAWPYELFKRAFVHSDRVEQVTQWRMRWLSPAGALGPVIALERPQGGGPCAGDSLVCGYAPAGPTLGAVASDRVMAVWRYPNLTYQEIGIGGRLSSRRAVPNIADWTSRYGYSQSFYSVAFGGDRALVTWWPYASHGRPDPVQVVGWAHGHWGRPVTLANTAGASMPEGSVAVLNARGLGVVVWDRLVAGARPAGMYASFER